jgi:hypothetical protein
LRGDAAATRRVRHQDRVAAGEREIGGQRSALGAAFFLDHLDQHNLAAADDFLDLVTLGDRSPAGFPRRAAAGRLGGFGFPAVIVAVVVIFIVFAVRGSFVGLFIRIRVVGCAGFVVIAIGVVGIVAILSVG